MQIDVADLRDFYASPLGGVARRVVSQRIRAHWRRADGLVIMGIGYATPYLGSFRGEAARLGALMPAEQGGVLWPTAGPVRSAMVDEEHLPLADNSVDRLLMVHCLETAGGHARPLLREAWRVLTAEGRLLIVVPNRRGVWARRDATPFGHGQPYSRAQLERRLTEALFTPIAWDSALHVPPFDKRYLARWSGAFENMGTRFWPLFAGVLLVEARKEMAQPILKGIGARVQRPVTVTEPSPAKRLVVPEACRQSAAVESVRNQLRRALISLPGCKEAAGKLQS
jgi:SAM-dependent methyltransferase